METKIKNYEHFIAAETEKGLSGQKREQLFRYHTEMLAEFQRERIIHLLVTFFFVLVTLAFIIGTSIFYYLTDNFDLPFYTYFPLIVLDIILIVLTFFYVKHYYFLENHIQGLYKFTKKILGE